MNRNQRYRELLLACLGRPVIRGMEPPDWREWLKCHICLAEQGQPCTSLSGRLAAAVPVPQLHPCGGRQPAPKGVRS